VQLRFPDKEHFFHDIAQMLQSGIPLQRALEQLGKGRDRGAAAARLAMAELDAGPGPALERAGFSALDSGIVTAGTQSGRLVEACRELADYYAHLSAGRRRTLAASAYPLFILHLGAVLLSIPPAILSGGPTAFFLGVGMFLGFAYLALGVLAAFLWLASKGFSRSPVIDRMVSILPVIGGFFRSAALARFCLVLSLGVRSAEGFLAGLARAGAASGSARLRRASGQAIAGIRGGEGLAAALQATGAIPPDLERALHVAEVSGRLDEEIGRWAAIYRERFFKRMESIAEWLPRILYLLVVGLVVVRMFALISQVSGIYSQVLEG